ncbi:CRISPR-associated protein Cas4 [Enterococcus columbae]|uniref:CRISPR-associated exonuclease Cas4 n=1 Tax=Enterococcus columbae DSM 7374 = ATCC 51263 TaxID=1121865 RepID=S0K6T0_9ENTE|nr:CRISPR-associated protein Cas4 [Enterococcus columbae]EOT40724.1 CRISPR-associated protein cas4 [Enterococcus columbae DSM 7374 = ATCC 51263]EOW80191.1 CRISPR-associated protein cas4 [Enterococcus columbae DSM 7374 = ATCC 51263]OJG20438.1 CRISPR-associated protein cas4 [Enterococcus columbae DSM 7374 = ATCC 51263]
MDEDDYLMLSGIQHFYFCKRQWGLIHLEQQWEENAATMQGQFLHEKADNPYLKEKRKDKFISRAIHVSSKRLGLSGILDVVEFYKDAYGISVKGKKGLWQPCIVEYKKGKKKRDNRDIVQLVAEVICLEETLNTKIDHSYLYYFESKDKLKIEITKELRNEVMIMAEQMHSYYDNKVLPKAEYFKNCSLCSLKDICLPRINKKPRNVENYIDEKIYGDEVL